MPLEERSFKGKEKRSESLWESLKTQFNCAVMEAFFDVGRGVLVAMGRTRSSNFVNAVIFALQFVIFDVTRPKYVLPKLIASICKSPIN